MSEFESIKNRLIVANGFSKTYAMTGWRIGYLLGPAEIIAKVNVVHQHTATCAAAPSQYGALAALQGSQDSVVGMCQTYEERRDFLVEGLKETMFRLVVPQGTFYAMLDVSDLNVTAGRNARELLNEFGIATVNGVAYGESASDYVRLCLTKNTEELERMIKRVKWR